MRSKPHRGRDAASFRMLQPRRVYLSEDDELGTARALEIVSIVFHGGDAFDAGRKLCWKLGSRVDRRWSESQQQPALSSPCKAILFLLEAVEGEGGTLVR
jgi:hypothetical protein